MPLLADLTKEKLPFFSDVPSESEIVIIASKAKPEEFLNALAPVLPFYEQWALRFSLDELAAFSLLQQTLASTWLNASNTDGLSINFSLKVLLTLKEKAIQEGLILNFQRTSLPLPPQAERVLFAAIFQFRTQIAILNALNITKDTFDSRLEQAFAEFYFDVFGFAPSTALRTDFAPIALALLKLSPPLEFKPNEEVFELVQGLLLYFLSQFKGGDSFSSDRYLIHLQGIKLPIQYEKGANVFLPPPPILAEPKSFFQRLWPWQLLSVFGFIGLFAFAVLFFLESSTSNSLLKEKALLESQTQILLSSVGKASALNKDMEQTLSLIQKEKARVFYLSGTEQAPETDVIVFTSTKNFKTYLFINTLLPNIKDKRYKIWYRSAGSVNYKLLAMLPKTFGTNALLSFGKSLKPTEFIITEQDAKDNSPNVKALVAK